MFRDFTRMCIVLKNIAVILVPQALPLKSAEGGLKALKNRDAVVSDDPSGFPTTAKTK
jgi:hypothetical protein